MRFAWATCTRCLCTETAACARWTFATWTPTTCAFTCGFDCAATFPAAATDGATAKAVMIAPTVAMRFMVFSRLVILMSPRVRVRLLGVVRARDIANVTAVTQTGVVEWPLLADLPAEDVRQLLAIARRRTFARGEVVFHRDDPADSLHLVVRGRFGARVLTPLGDSVLVDVLGPGQSFGELALLLPDARRSATVEALEASETRSVFRDDFAALQRDHPGVKDVLLRLLAEQLRRSTDRVVEAHHVAAETRIRRRLLELAAMYDDGVVPLTQEDIAAMAGTSRATVNRVLREEEKLGAVALARGRTTVLDADDLERRCRRS